MRNIHYKHWIGVGALILLFLVISATIAFRADTGAGTSSKMEAWLDEGTGVPVTCDEVIHMAEVLLPHMLNDFNNASDEDCLGPVAGMSRREAWEVMLLAANEEAGASETSGVLDEEGVPVPLLPGTSADDGEVPDPHLHQTTIMKRIFVME